MPNRPRRRSSSLIPHPSSLIPLLIPLLLTLTLLTPWVSAKETKSKPQEWQIRGIEAALEDERSGVKVAALDKFSLYQTQEAARLAKPDTIQKIANLFKDYKQDSNDRASAAAALGDFGEAAKAYIPAILKFIKNDMEDFDSRDKVAVALSNFGEVAKAYIPDIGNILRDDRQSLSVRVNAAVVLSNFGEVAKAYIPDIGNILKDDRQIIDVRLTAAEALGNFGEVAKAYIPDIGNILKDDKQNSDVRIKAAVALSNFGEAAKAYIPDILNLINDDKQGTYTRARAAVALSNSGEAAKAYIPDILNFIKDDKQVYYHRASAAAALGNFGEAVRSYIPDIGNILKDAWQSIDVRVNAAVALSNLGEVAKAYIPDIGNILKDNRQSIDTRLTAAEALDNFGEAAKAYIPDILNLVNFIKDKKQDIYISTYIRAAALGSFDEAAKAYIPRILNAINDDKQESYVRNDAVEALGNLGPLSFTHVVPLLNPAYEEPTFNDSFQVSFNAWRFYAYWLSGGDEEVRRLLKWVAKPKQLPTQLNHDEVVKTLELFKRAWEPSKELLALRDDLANKIALVAKTGRWQTGDIALLQQHYNNLKAANSPNADSVQAAIASLTIWQWISNTWTAILTHAAFWLALVFAYPKSSQIQAIFFWNPWVRNILGLGYVSFLLTWVPFLRRKLFEPFKVSLLADAGLSHFDSKGYFGESGVGSREWGESQPISEVMPGY